MTIAQGIPIHRAHAATPASTADQQELLTMTGSSVALHPCHTAAEAPGAKAAPSSRSRIRALARDVGLSALFISSALFAGCGSGGGSDDVVNSPSGGTVGGVTTPVVVTQPMSVTVSPGGSATFSVVATGDGLA
jgi:hypothetical protein